MADAGNRLDMMDESQFHDLQEALSPYFRIRGYSENNGMMYLQGDWRNNIQAQDLTDVLEDQFTGYSFSVKSAEQGGIIQVRDKTGAGTSQKYWLHGLLFVLTVFTTLFAGALMDGVVPWPDLTLLAKGLPFSLTLMLILGTHELGHYLYARIHNVDATLPYFIPAPTFIGTFGAFIKMRSPIVDKRSLLEIGAAGPIAGFIVTIPALFLGLSQSTIVHLGEIEGSIQLGDSIFMWLATNLMYPGLGANQDIMLSPVAFAAWIGLLVTALNLLPIGQLDGGHIAYALFGKRHKWIARIAFAALIPLSFLSTNWLIWAVLILVLIRVQHPPILNETQPLSRTQQVIGWISLIIFIGSFIPQPISM